MFLVNRAHQSRGGRQDFVDEDEDGLLGAELDALADHVDELADGEVGGDQVFLLVDRRDVRLFDFLADDLDSDTLVSCHIGRKNSFKSKLDKKKGTRNEVFLIGESALRHTGILSVYFWRMRSASALRFSNGCSSLNLERILIVSEVFLVLADKGFRLFSVAGEDRGRRLYVGGWLGLLFVEGRRRVKGSGRLQV